MNDTLIILNPAAGGGGGADRVRDWAARRPKVELRVTEGPGDARRWARDAAEQGRHRVVAAGGDGTVHEVASGLLDHGEDIPTLALLPLGTGNDLARSLQVPDELEAALEILERGRVRGMDVARVRWDGDSDQEGDGSGESFLVNALTGGFSGELHDSLDEGVKSAWGPLSYLKTGLEEWGERSTYAITVSVDGESQDYEALNLVVANGASAGGGMPISPEADPFDGVLNVLVVRDAPGWELSALAARMLAGEPGDHDALDRRRGRSVLVEADESFPVSLDGERITVRTLDLELRPGTLSVVVGG